MTDILDQIRSAFDGEDIPRKNLASAPTPMTDSAVLTSDQLCTTPLIEELVPTNAEWEACEVVQDRYNLMKRRVRLAFACAAAAPAPQPRDTTPPTAGYSHDPRRHPMDRRRVLRHHLGLCWGAINLEGDTKMRTVIEYCETRHGFVTNVRQKDDEGNVLYSRFPGWKTPTEIERRLEWLREEAKPSSSTQPN